MTVVRIQEVLDISNRGIHDKRSDVIDVVMVSCSSSYPLSFIIMSTSQQNKEPNTQEPQKPWYEDRWFDEPLNLQFRKFEDKIEKPGYEKYEPPKSDKPWYEDRWYEKPLNLKFRKFDDTVKEGYERVEPSSKSDRPWYEDRWYEKPLDMHFRNFDALETPGPDQKKDGQ